jgi:Protein of unknown function (DUF2934)
MTNREKRIQEIAYHLWVQEGHPEGRSDSHYFEAVTLYETEIAGREGVEAEEPVAESKAKPRKPQPAKPVAEKPNASAKPNAAKAAAEAQDAKRKTVEAEPAATPPAKAPAGGAKRKPAKS